MVCAIAMLCCVVHLLAVSVCMCAAGARHPSDAWLALSPRTQAAAFAAPCMRSCLTAVLGAQLRMSIAELSNSILAGLVSITAGGSHPVATVRGHWRVQLR